MESGKENKKGEKCLWMISHEIAQFKYIKMTIEYFKCCANILRGCEKMYERENLSRKKNNNKESK